MPRRPTPVWIEIDIPNMFDQEGVRKEYLGALQHYRAHAEPTFTGTWPFPEIPRMHETVLLGEGMFKIRIEDVQYQWEKRGREINIFGLCLSERLVTHDLLSIAALGLGIDNSGPIREILKAAKLPTTPAGDFRRFVKPTLSA